MTSCRRSAPGCRGREPDPDAAERQALLKDARIDLPKGRATLISGASGSGKSTVFRALAGIWPFGQGHVTIPAGARVLFLPQKPYIPIGTLRDAVKYLDEQSMASDADIVAALQDAQLGQLDEEAHWSNMLSGGEQQRLAVARALVFKPDWLFMDEATASLDEAAEAAIYGAIKERLPGTPIVSIGHRPTCGDGMIGDASWNAGREKSASWSRCRHPLRD